MLDAIKWVCSNRINIFSKTIIESAYNTEFSWFFVAVLAGVLLKQHSVCSADDATTYIKSKCLLL